MSTQTDWFIAFIAPGRISTAPLIGVVHKRIFVITCVCDLNRIAVNTQLSAAGDSVPTLYNIFYYFTMLLFYSLRFLLIDYICYSVKCILYCFTIL